MSDKVSITTYDKISDTDLTVSDDFFDSYDGTKTDLIKDILDNIKDSGDYIVGHSKDSQNKDLKFYNNLYNGEAFYDGIAGVLRVRKTFELNKFKDVEFDVKLQLTTKFDVSEKPYFLATMLLYDKLTLSNNMIPSNEEEIYDYMLLFWFKEQLQRACLKGLFKTYRYFERNDEKLRGAIDIARHIKLNAGQSNGKIAYRYRENTTNNYLNYLIVAAYTHLKEKYYDLVSENIDSNPDLLSAINQLKNDTGYVKGSLKTVISKNLRAITHPLYTEYEELRVTSIRILRDEGLSIFDGEEDDSQGILFYVPDLWENFLESIMSEHIECLKKNTVYLSSQEELSVLSKPNKKDEYFLETRPDYVFYNDKNFEKPIMVLDAKFRPDWERAILGGSLDLMSYDYTKCLRDMCDFGVHSTGVIFPYNNTDSIDNLEDRIKHTISRYNNEDYFYTIPIKVPSSENSNSYSDWHNEFFNLITTDIEAVNAILQEITDRKDKD